MRSPHSRLPQRLSTRHCVDEGVRANLGRRLRARPELAGAATGLARPENVGTGGVSASVANPQALVASDYEVRFEAGGINVIRLSDGTSTAVPALPAEVDGVKQMPFDGVSMKYSFDKAEAATTHPVQYYEMFGNRAIYDNGWKAVTLHGNRMPWVIAGTFDFDQDVWELYNLKDDPTETHNLAFSNPQKLEELKQKWEEEAIKYNVYPLYDDVAARAANVQKRSRTADTYTYYPPGAEFISEALSPPVKNRGHTITASLETDGSTDGVIVACGGFFAGYTLYVKENIVTYTYNTFDQKYYTITDSHYPCGTGRGAGLSPQPVPAVHGDEHARAGPRHPRCGPEIHLGRMRPARRLRHAGPALRGHQ